MLYLNNSHIQQIGINWAENIQVIRQAIDSLYKEDFNQPIKPFLRFKDPVNRIIAMPAYVGGETDIAGIKWIASFPNNIHQSIPRAHCSIVLNDSDTGIPVTLINSGQVSCIRTAAITGLMIQEYQKIRPVQNAKIGLIGYGPIGQHHLAMVESIVESIDQILLYDLRPIDINDIPESIREKVKICDNWQDTYVDSDIFMTCTVTKERYVDLPPKTGSLVLNVSLRDFHPEIIHHNPLIVVDDWEEVCRENTDIEVMYKKHGLQESQTISITDIVCRDALKDLAENQAVFFNPMGMAVFDVAVARYYYDEALKNNIGVQLED